MAHGICRGYDHICKNPCGAATMWVVSANTCDLSYVSVLVSQARLHQHDLSRQLETVSIAEPLQNRQHAQNPFAVNCRDGGMEGRKKGEVGKEVGRHKGRDVWRCVLVHAVHCSVAQRSRLTPLSVSPNGDESGKQSLYPDGD